MQDLERPQLCTSKFGSKMGHFKNKGISTALEKLLSPAPFKIALLAFKACLPAYKYGTTMVSSIPPVQSMRPRETKIFAFLLAIIIFVDALYG